MAPPEQQPVCSSEGPNGGDRSSALGRAPASTGKGAPEGPLPGAPAPPPEEDFHWTTLGISHPKRRRQILEAHPEVQALSGECPLSGFFAICVCLLSLWLGVQAAQWDLSWGWLALYTYAIGGTLNHILFLAMHEASHCLFFKSTKANELLAIFVNLPMCVPAGISFMRYHLDHHIWTGHDFDTDIPTEIEARLLRSRLGKVIFVLLLPFTYSLRPLLRNPKPFAAMEALNWFVILLWDVWVYVHLGPKALFYYLGGTLMSMSIHPLNGHLIAEHYQFPRGQPLQETWSSYGPENWITFCVGHHIEHHDFPRIPGYRLPQLKKIAAEFYDLPYHKSWLHCLFEFLTDDSVTPFSRVRRVSPKGGPVRPPHKPRFKEPQELGSYWMGPSKDTSENTQAATVMAAEEPNPNADKKDKNA